MSLIEKSLNMLIEETKQGINDTLSKSGLPVGILNLIITEVSGTLNRRYAYEYTLEQRQYSENKEVVEDGGSM